MARRRKSSPDRIRVGKVSLYLHHGSWYAYYRESGRPIRVRLSIDQAEALAAAEEIDRNLSLFRPSPFGQRAISLEELRREFLADHEHVRRSSLATLNRYRAATQHVLNFVATNRRRDKLAEFPVEEFVRYLRQTHVSPNGHANTAKRPLRDRGLQYVLEVTRSLFEFARRRQYLPSHLPNPFFRLRIDLLRVEDQKPVYCFDESSELTFLEAASGEDLPVFGLLAKTGLRPGEATHLLIEDLDLTQRWLDVRNRPQLGWRIKTGRERRVPLIPELCLFLDRHLAGRTSGPVLLRPGMQRASVPVWTAEQMESVLQERLRQESSRLGKPLTRQEQAKLAERLWREVGIWRTDKVRLAFMRITRQIGLSKATCPKSWRHTFATLLQDANVDPLIRQIVMGHKPQSEARGALGMTSVYTHSRPETIQREIFRALRLWPRSLQLLAERTGHAGALLPAEFESPLSV